MQKPKNIQIYKYSNDDFHSYISVVVSFVLEVRATGKVYVNYYVLILIEDSQKASVNSLF